MTKQKDTLPYIMIQGAMDSELSLLLEHLQEERQETLCNFTFHIGSLQGQKVILVKTFQGMVNASACTMLALEHFKPALIINQGVCGGHDKRLHRGDIILGESIINYGNLRITPAEASTPVQGWELIGVEMINPAAPNQDKTTVFYSNPLYLEKAQKISAQFQQDNPGVTVVTGRIGSADIWTDREDYITQIQEKFQTCGEDMESAAVAQLCTAFSTPFLSIRTLSNTLVHHEDFEENTALTGQRFLLQLIETF